MPTELKRLPPIAVPDAFYELVRLYAFQERASISGAVRQLLQNSPELAELAVKQGVDLEALKVREWGKGSEGPAAKLLHERRDLQKAGEILANRGATPEAQLKALDRLMAARGPHKSLISRLLRKALDAHIGGYGPVQEAIVLAMQTIGDSGAISQLQKLRNSTDDVGVLDAIDTTIKKLLAQPSIGTDL